ncbi:hyaluronan-mediated motility receptor (RHAMM) [Pseudothermotoga thermarum]|uniref:Hyaluronan-mediated motility receptor (RHAMM) n=1 Tax=Pseudothermotoga thermarum DSM 5069 TaxID=688269 RepID=F7YXW3_9THEM|nr:hyaluronan-mediated motility receptor (RHAMM) [Pseudothermotoga thermarum]AEH50762.1 hyaluronan-mediated motility receptor (RHAMM) [Pseudothermotoga thermarum DSM 5069]
MRRKYSLKRLSVKMIKSLLQLIEDELKETCCKKKRGRPREYSERRSFRDTVFYLEEIFKKKMPAISTLHYW